MEQLAFSPPALGQEITLVGHGVPNPNRVRSMPCGGHSGLTPFVSFASDCHPSMLYTDTRQKSAARIRKPIICLVSIAWQLVGDLSQPVVDPSPSAFDLVL